jgi:predicted nucleic acid-binding protein
VDINGLPGGASCLIDSNIFIYHLSGRSTECSEFMARIGCFEIQAFVTTTTVAEVLHRRMIAEALTKNLIGPGQPLKKLKANPGVIQTLTDYFAEVEDLLQLPFQIIETTRADISASRTFRRAHGLFVNDSINLACANNRGLTDIVSHDADFRRVPSINIWEPTDV